MYEIKLKGTQSKGTIDPLRLYQKWVPMQEIHSKKEEEEEACYLFLLYRNELQPVFLLHVEMNIWSLIMEQEHFLL